MASACAKGTPTYRASVSSMSVLPDAVGPSSITFDLCTATSSASCSRSSHGDPARPRSRPAPGAAPHGVPSGNLTMPGMSTRPWPGDREGDTPPLNGVPSPGAGTPGWWKPDARSTADCCARAALCISFRRCWAEIWMRR